MSLPSSMADFVPCDRLLQKAYSLMKAERRAFLSKGNHINRLLFLTSEWNIFISIANTAIAVGILCAFFFHHFSNYIPDQPGNKTNNYLNNGYDQPNNAKYQVGHKLQINI